MANTNHRRVLITGITSIHGWPIFQVFQKLLPPDLLFGIKPPNGDLPVAENVICACITDKKKLREIKDRFRPTYVIHCAGVCDLDVCEDRPDWAHAINVTGTRNIMDIFGKDIPVLYMSTDLVFSGKNPPSGGYPETAAPDPIHVAGRTFAEAEKTVQKHNGNHCIVRLGLPLGDSVNGAKGAIDWIESRFKRGLPVTLFYDEYRSCVSCKSIGEMAVSVLNLDLKGLYHFGGEKKWSLHDIGEFVIKKGGYSPSLLKGIMRHEEKIGPPRIGDVSMDSAKLKRIIEG